jgi:hypothetical protein
MFKEIWYWTVEAPATAAAALLSLVILATPVAAGIATWLGIYKLFRKERPSNDLNYDKYRDWQRGPAILAWAVALYILFVMSGALFYLPHAIGTLLKNHG